MRVSLYLSRLFLSETTLHVDTLLWGKANSIERDLYEESDPVT